MFVPGNRVVSQEKASKNQCEGEERHTHRGAHLGVQLLGQTVGIEDHGLGMQ